MFTKSRRRYQKPGTEVKDSCKPPYGSWELNRSSTRAASALNCGAIPPGLFLFVRHNLAIRLSWQSESASASLDYRCIPAYPFRILDLICPGHYNKMPLKAKEIYFLQFWKLEVQMKAHTSSYSDKGPFSVQLAYFLFKDGVPAAVSKGK